MVAYGASGGFTTANAPGPADRGLNFFTGGNAPKSTATQTISLKSFAGKISGGSVGYKLTGWLGCYEGQGDNAVVTLVFKDAAGAALKPAAVLGPVTNADRANETGLFQRSTAGTVPARAAVAAVTITINRLQGSYNDGSVDDLTLILN